MIRSTTAIRRLVVLRRILSPSSISFFPKHNNNNGHKTLVTTAQKRALKKEQISGGSGGKKNPTEMKSNGTGTGTGPAGTTTSSSSTGNTGTDVSTSGGGSGMVPIIAVTALASAVRGAYYMDMIPLDTILGKNKEEKEDKGLVVITKDEEEINNSDSDGSTTIDTAFTPANKEEHDETLLTQEEGNRVTTISFPPADTNNRPAQIVPPVEHIPGGHRVSVEHLNSVWYGTSSAEATPSVKQQQQETSNRESTTTKTTTTNPSTVGVSGQQALSELKLEIDQGKDLTMEKADKAIIKENSTSLDSTLLADLDKLNDAQLKVRLVQLASEMEHRSKWEAVRLKEFLAMKEREVSEKNLEVLQKQRLEFEEVLARRLREQEDNLSRQANAIIQSKEQSIQSVVEDAAKAQTAEHEAELKDMRDRFQREIGAKHESEFGAKLAEEKASFLKELEQKVNTIEELVGRLQKVEQLLKISKDFESGSQRAHRVSASVLALASKLETSDGAAEEFSSLKSAAIENGVIASALSKIPSSVKKGIPTVTELQARFDKVYSATRKAAYVPENRPGLDGQIAGAIFSSLALPPSPDALADAQSESKLSSAALADFILSRAKNYVSLGDMEMAVEELEKLKGQAAFTAKDWKQSALDRVAVEKALGVIKMECAILNKNMSG
eukprot:CAMPEP_0184856316 /NCGR_PEP_ID=MMETSP0580-20130426/1510_1 /TAXON_ID=1118495 /ORGANISM="Dactyliosolen fragilissimus" /LENGTH=668 /DNA_ID=CAMNT_0027351291 /DNA_START=215 /DNA_END=2221 /DNA_ORIENTATION=+